MKLQRNLYKDSIKCTQCQYWIKNDYIRAILVNVPPKAEHSFEK